MEEKERGTVELAEAAAVNKETISLWRGGTQKSYDYEKVARVATELETTAEELLDLPTPPPASPLSAQPGDAPRRDLLQRIAKLAPVIAGLAELEKVVAEAERLSR